MQGRIRFPLTSEQCELLAAFEAAGSLQELAKLMAKDASVVSRQLQGLADSGVLAKVNQRWTLTALGRQMNHWTRNVAASQRKILDQQAQRGRFLDARHPSLHARTALVAMSVQKGFDDPVWGVRNNVAAEDNIAALLAAWRAARRPVIHVRHHSRENQSPLRPGSIGAEFKDGATPAAGEAVVTKGANSAFAGTDFKALLDREGIDTLVLMGFTTNHCVDATARAAGDMGLNVFVVEDACVAFERVAHDGSTVKAEDVQRVVMANLNQEFATVIDAESVLRRIADVAPEAP